MRIHPFLAATCSFLVWSPLMAQTGPCIPRNAYHLRLDQPALSVDVEYANISHGQVLHNAPPYNDRPNAVEYEIVSECGGTYRLDLKSAALEPRPVRVRLNGTTVRERALARATGGWDPQHQAWFEGEAVLSLAKGANRLRLERDSVFPHISEIELILCRSPHSCYDRDINGVWSSLTERGEHYQFYQDGGDVVGIYANPYFSHLFRGSFTGAGEVQGAFENRIDRRDGCATQMDASIRFVDHDRFELRWRARETKCGLTQGHESPWIAFERVW